MLWRFSLNRTSRRTTAFKAQRQTTYRASYVSPLPAVVKQQPGVTGQQSSLSHSLYGSEILSVTESQIMQAVNTHNYYILRCMWILWLTKNERKSTCDSDAQLTFSKLASLLSRPCTKSTAKLSVCKEAFPFGAPFSVETTDRSISPSRSAMDIWGKKRGKNGPTAFYRSIYYSGHIKELWWIEMC